MSLLKQAFSGLSRARLIGLLISEEKGYDKIKLACVLDDIAGKNFQP